MLARKIEQSMAEWKNTVGHKPLICRETFMDIKELPLKT